MLVVCGVFVFALAISGFPFSFAQELTWSQVIARVKPSVVFIQAELPSEVVTGSGVIISSDGYILTAAHVVYKAKRIRVLINDKDWYEAALIAVHPKWLSSQETPSADVALLKIAAANLPALPFGDVNQLEYEEEIRILGYPLPAIGLGFIAVAGTVQGIRTTPEGVQLIQHNAPSDRGQSGAPVINRRGELVGIEILAYGTEWSKFRLAVAVSSVWEVVPHFVSTLGTPRPQNIQTPQSLLPPSLSVADFHLVHTIRPAKPWRSMCIALSPNGQLLAIVSSVEGEAVIELWDTDTGVLTNKIQTGQSGYSFALSFSPDGSFIAYTNKDGFVGVWEVHTGSLLWQTRYVPSIISVAFSADGTWLAVGTDQSRFGIWCAKTGEKLVDRIAGHCRYVHSLAFSPDNALFAVSLGGPDYIVSVWDTRTWRHVAVLSLQDSDGTPLTPVSIAFSSDGNILAVGTNTIKAGRNQTEKVYLGQVILWHRQGNSFKFLGVCSTHTEWIQSVIFTTNNLLLVVYDNAVALCDLRVKDSPKCISFPKEYSYEEGYSFCSAAISLDGRVLAIRKGWSITIWKLGNHPQ